MKVFSGWVGSKYAKAGAMLSVLAASLATSAFAVDPAAGTDVVDTVSASMTTAIGGFAEKAATILGSIVVAAIPIAGAIWLARKAFGWFKSTAK